MQRLDDVTGKRLADSAPPRARYEDWLLSQIIGRDAAIFSLQEARSVHEERLAVLEAAEAERNDAAPSTFWRRLRWLVRGR
jgi:hypothetical protein